MLSDILEFLFTQVKRLWAFLVAGLVAVLAFFNINVNWLTPETTTAAPTTIVTTPTTTTAAGPQNPFQAFSVTVKLPGESPVTFTHADAFAAGLQPQAGVVVTSVNSAGTTTDYTVTGVRLKDILEACGVILDELDEDSYVTVFSGSAGKKYEGADLIRDGSTILATSYTSHAVDGVTGAVTDKTAAQNAPDCPRMFPGQGIADSQMYVKQVDTLELCY